MTLTQRLPLSTQSSSFIHHKMINFHFKLNLEGVEMSNYLFDLPKLWNASI